jgi:hypothetical protein
MTHSNEHSTNKDVGGHFWKRIARVLWLDPRLFDEVEEDPRGLLQAVWIVLVAGLSRGGLGLSAEHAPGVVASVAGAIILWLVATGLLTTVGVRWLHGVTDFREMLRTLGFAAVPLWLLAPVVLLEGHAHTAVVGLVHLWAIAAAVIAVRQALDVGTARALAACGLSLALAIGLLLLLGVPHGASG